MSSPYHHPKGSNYRQALCGQWSLFKELKVSTVSVTCKKCLKALNQASLNKNGDSDVQDV